MIGMNERKPRYFTHYWTNKTWKWNASSSNELLNHTAGNLFNDRKVTIGDVVYVVTVIKGKLYVCGRLKVGIVCDLSEAARILNWGTDELWQAEEHLIAAEATPMNFNREIPLELTQSLKFKTGEGLKPLAFTSQEHLDKQTLRGVRELDEESALELDRLLPPLQKFQLDQYQESLAEPIFPDEISSGQIYCEGAVKQVQVNAYERNPEARKACIERYGLKCNVCCFDFEKVYGEIGKGFIHVHHLVPISHYGDEQEINPIEDLRPVCPNCHAMLHKKNPPYEIAELKQKLEENKASINRVP